MAAHWSARVQAALPAPLTEGLAELLAESLATHQATVTFEQANVAARFDVEASTLRIAVTNGIKAMADALDALGIPHVLTSAEVSTYDVLDAELARPAVPELVGMAEIATLLGVSRQRAHELSDRPDFPSPVQPLAAGAVYIKAQVEAFNGRWERRKGRPKKSAA